MGGIRLAILMPVAVLLTTGLCSCAGSKQAASSATSSQAASSATAEPGVLPTDVATSGPNLARPGEQPPLLPVVATKDTPAGAAAFARFFVQTVDWGFATTSGTYMAHYFDPACDQCQQIKSGLDAAGVQGWHFVGGRYTITSAKVTSSSGTTPAVQVMAAIAASKTVDANGVEQSSTPAIAKFTATLTLTWQSGWTVVGIDTGT